ncbi:FAD/FMN-containing dehydrogenase [Promicromonospora umidemergens]|uniref:FAD/FMN-containing dehydrogenase n=1 Tax=Promicromonospora umidemergens TaxID=629679 RepID=A0ABP8WYE3_9MICO|nr:FAD-binding protein [Promicromonospora umidemergens]MCP2285556.1 FAD/FMN-containing dehydrogenase [Promicromonospora umidemergens]
MERHLINTLAAAIEGPVLLPGQDGYDEERTGFNLAVRHHPDVIVGATQTKDVVAAVAFAAEQGLPVAVLGTGHGSSTAAEGGLLITTRRMSTVHVDPETRRARVGAGARFEHVVPEAARYGLAPLNGSAPHVGVVGYTLGGGLPLLGRSHGWAADQVAAMDVVTADGRLHHVTPAGEPDLYFALLGGRDNFGVVTQMEFGLVPVARLFGGGLFFDAGQTPGLLAAYREWAATVPDEMNSSVALIPFPDDPQVPEPLRGRHVWHLRIAFTGSPEDGARIVAPLRQVGSLLLETLHDMPYEQSAEIHDDPPVPMPWAADDALLSDLDDDAVRTILEHAGPGADLPVIVELRHLGGTLARRAEHPNAVGHREARFMLAALVPLTGVSPADAQAHLERLFTDLEPWTSGRFLNFMGHGAAARQDLVATAYTSADHRRLTALKEEYDPGNVFRLNYNIPPRAPGPDLPTTTTEQSVTFINIFEISAEHHDAFIAQWERRAALMSTKPGFIDSRLHRARSSQTRFQLVNVSHWASQEALDAAGTDPEFRERTQAARESSDTPVISSPGLYDVAVALSPAENPT